jgi:hypothetical protein
MYTDQAVEITKLVEQEVALRDRMKTEAEQKAHSLIKAYLGSLDHCVQDVPRFYSALAEALREAREQGQFDRSDDALTLI